MGHILSQLSSLPPPPLDLSSLSPCVQEHIVVFLSGLPWTFNSSSLRDVQSHPDGYLPAMTNVHAHCSHGLLTKYSSREPAFEMSSLSAQRVKILFLLCFSLPCLITVTRAWKKMCAFFFCLWGFEFVCVDMTMWMHVCVFSQVYVSMHASVHRSSERMWPWIWSAVAGSVFTRPKEQWQCVIRGRQANGARPKHSWHQGTARWPGNHHIPFD